MIINRKLSKSKTAAFVSNVLNLKAFNLPEVVEKEVSKVFAKYFIDNSNWFLYFKDDVSNKPLGLLAASINNERGYVDLNFDKLLRISKKYNNTFLNELFEFQTRITNTIKMRHDSSYESELILFSSLVKGQGIGTQLIKAYEAHLESLNINAYCLFTDDNCDYEWYIKHQYRMVGKYEIQTNDLKTLFIDPNKKYYVYKFFKVI